MTKSWGHFCSLTGDFNIKVSNNYQYPFQTKIFLALHNFKVLKPQNVFKKWKKKSNGIKSNLLNAFVLISAIFGKFKNYLNLSSTIIFSSIIYVSISIFLIYVSIFIITTFFYYSIYFSIIIEYILLAGSIIRFFRIGQAAISPTIWLANFRHGRVIQDWRANRS